MPPAASPPADLASADVHDRPAAPPDVTAPAPTTPGTCRPGPDGTWWWDGPAAALHALPAGTVVPTDALLLAHCRPEDRDALAGLLRGTAGPGVVRYRLTAADGTERLVLAVAAPAHGPDPRPVVALTDLSAEIDAAAVHRADAMLAEALASRGRIDQAKGALMLTYGLDEDGAFDLLRWHSEHLNIKLRTAAERVCAVMPLPLAGDPRDRVDEVLAHGAGLDSPPPGRRTVRDLAARPGLTLARTPPDREVVVHVAGEVDASTVPALVSGVHEALRAVRSTRDRPGTLVVDLTGVRRLGPLAGLHLGRLRRRCDRAQVHLRLVAPMTAGRAHDAEPSHNDVTPDRPTREDA